MKEEIKRETYVIIERKKGGILGREKRIYS
jgi:hypothetical protein